MRSVSIPFRADTGFEQIVGTKIEQGRRCVSIPFRADTGFELYSAGSGFSSTFLFQSLSGLTLGLNWLHSNSCRSARTLFQSLSGLTLGLNA